MLDWLDGRNGSSFQGVSYAGNRLTFSVQRGATARGLQAMLPASSATGPLTSLTRDGAAVSAPIRRVKGIDYAVFDAAAGSYAATYGAASVPETTITQASVSGNRAVFAFTGTGAAGFQCRIDAGAFTPCSSGQQYTGLTRGGHSFQVRAIDAAGIVDPTPAEHRFTIGTAVLGTGSGSSRKVTLAPRRVRVSRAGRLKLRVSCPPSEQRCRVKLRLRAGGKTLASRTFKVSGGATRHLRLTLRRPARQKLFQKGAWRVTATAVSRNSAGDRTVTRKTVRLLAP
jgi:hypothetical protein